jgi:hypothetical protein
MQVSVDFENFLETLVVHESTEETLRFVHHDDLQWEAQNRARMTPTLMIGDKLGENRRRDPFFGRRRSFLILMGK